MKALITKIRPGSISEGIAQELERLGYEITELPKGLDIRSIDQYPFWIDPETTILVNTIGVTDTDTIGNWMYNRADKLVSVNLTGAIALTAAFVRATSGTDRDKHIFHVGSLWSRKHATNSAVYCAAKAGLAHFVACAGYDLNLEFGNKYSITGIHPGNVKDTPLTKRVQANLINTRGFNNNQVDDLYKNAITTKEIAESVSRVLFNPWYNGENVYLGGGDKR